jgi:prolyl-tRNA editing enzyme YbaK/EbsC (Cys-tRNA(Pro) deacylase)
MHPNCVAVEAVLVAAELPGRIRLLEEAAPTAAAAAELLGVEVGAIANSLIFATGDGEAVLVLASGAHRVDTARAGAALGVGPLRRADAGFVRAATGQPIGGVAPFGHPRPLRTAIDTALAAHARVWAGGGIPHAMFPTTFDELRALTDAVPADLGVDSDPA